MTKSDISYASVPTITSTGPYVEGFPIGSSHAVTVIVDEADQTARPSATNGTTRSTNAYATDYGVPLLHGSRKPIQIPLCPYCSAEQVRTKTRTYPNVVTWAGVVLTAAVCFPLFWVPLVVDPCKRTDHYCQNCGKKVGSIKPLEGFCVKERM